MGNYDKRIAEYAAQIFIEGWAPLIMFTGKKGNFTENWDTPEAEVFAEIAIELGVPREKVIIEDKATNTGENITFSKNLLQEKKDFH